MELYSARSLRNWTAEHEPMLTVRSGFRDWERKKGVWTFSSYELCHSLGVKSLDGLYSPIPALLIRISIEWCLARIRLITRLREEGLERSQE